MAFKRTFFRIGKILFPIFLIIFIIYEGKKELSGLSFRAALHAVQLIPRGGFALAVLIGLLSIAVMSAYDFVLIKSAQFKVPVWRLFRIAWIANALNGIAGFGGLAGAALRAGLYRKYTNQQQETQQRLVRAISWMTPFMLSGLSVLALLVLLDILPAHRALHREPWLWLAVAGIFVFLPGYVLIVRLRGQQSASTRTMSMYVIGSAVEWSMAGVTTYTIMRLLAIHISFPHAMGAFAVAAIAGTISLVPGGFGSFDLMLIIALQAHGIDKGAVLSTLILYRIVYYLIPFGVGLIFAALEMPADVMKQIEEHPMVRQTVEAGGVIWAFQRTILAQLGYWSVAALVFLAGTMTVILVAIPLPQTYYQFIHGALHLPDWLLTIGSALTLAFGLSLAITARGIYHRTRRSYYMTQIALAGSIIFAFVRGFYPGFAISLLVLALVLYALRKQFIRTRLILTIPSVIWYVLLGGFGEFCYYIIAVAIAENVPPTNLRASDFVINTFWQVNGITLISIVVLLVYLLGGVFWFNRMIKKVPGELPDMARLREFLDEHGGHVLSHLGYLGDKRFFFSEDGQALIQFTRLRKRLIVLGDPSGNPASFSAALAQFVTDADKLGYTIVFYQIASQFMALYHDLGYRFFKLGEEAIVNLDVFSLEGKKRAGLRAVKNKFEREGYTFEVVQPPFTDDFMGALKHVSDAFLRGKHEKGFSLGYFDRPYLDRMPIAILRSRSGDIRAFMSLMPVYQSGVISVDLMRYPPDAPSGIMDAMFLHLFSWAKEAGYHAFNLGMAPLSNVGRAQNSFLSERIAAAIFNHISYAYSFSGLRRFKHKYEPTWQGKYLAYRKNRSLPGTMYFVSRLIGQGPRG